MRGFCLNSNLVKYASGDKIACPSSTSTEFRTSLPFYPDLLIIERRNSSDEVIEVVVYCKAFNESTPSYIIAYRAGYFSYNNSPYIPIGQENRLIALDSSGFTLGSGFKGASSTQYMFFKAYKFS